MRILPSIVIAVVTAAPLAWWAAVCSAELPPLIPRALLVGDPARAAAQLSPDGKRLAYIAPDQRSLQTLWVRTIGKEDDHPVTSALDRPVFLPSPLRPKAFSWQTDNKHLLFMLDHDGDEIEHLYQVAVDSGELRDLTPFKGVRAFPIAGGEKYADAALVALNLRDRNVMDAYRLELDTGKLTEVARNPGDVAEWFGNNRGEVVAAQAVHLKEESVELRVRDTEGDPWRYLATFGSDETVGTSFSHQLVCGFSADDHRIRLAESAGAPTTRLVEMDLQTGKTTVVDEDADADVGGWSVNPRTGEVDAVWRWKERRVWTVRNPLLKTDFDLLHAVSSGDMAIDSRDAADNRWIVSFIQDRSPTVSYLYDRQTHHIERLFSTQPALERYRLAEMRPVTFAARDGLTLHGFLTLPVGIEPHALPMVLMVHGGPHLRDLWGMNGWVQLLANRGYAVLQVEFRGSMGYGKALLHAGDRAWGKQMQDDLIDAKRWAVKEGYTDPARCAIGGFSYGGYASLAALALAPREFACGVAAAAPSDLVSLVRNIRPDWLMPRLQFAQRLGDPDRDRAELQDRSPRCHAGSIVAPLLIGQGMHDIRVPPAVTERFVDELQRLGIPVEYLRFPSEGHTWIHPETRIQWAEATERFLAEHLGGRVEGPTLQDLLPRFDDSDPHLLR